MASSLQDALRDAGYESVDDVVARLEAATLERVNGMSGDQAMAFAWQSPENAAVVAVSRWAWEQYALTPDAPQPSTVLDLTILSARALLRLPAMSGHAAEVQRRWPLSTGMARRASDHRIVLADGQVAHLLTHSETPPETALTTPDASGWLEVAGDVACWMGPEMYSALEALRAHAPGKVYLTAEFAARFKVHPRDNYGLFSLKLPGNRPANRVRVLPLQPGNGPLKQHLERIRLVQQAMDLLPGAPHLSIPDNAWWVNIRLAESRAGAPCLRETPEAGATPGALVFTFDYCPPSNTEYDVDFPPAPEYAAEALWSDHAPKSGNAAIAGFVPVGTALYIGFEDCLYFDGEKVRRMKTWDIPK